MGKLQLNCHPSTPCPSVRRLEAAALMQADGTLALSFMLEGDIARLRIAQPGAPRRADCLWQHSCFETFVRVGDESAYLEFNFAASGAWAAYCFHDYRQGATVVEGEPVSAPRVSSSADRIELETRVRLDALASVPRSLLRVGLSAVLEDDSGVLSYWALKHPPGKPDFHHADAFTLILDPLSSPLPLGGSTGKNVR
ncbi:MAG: DOMON-like domain-containing protein [Burkholderiales bacterium]